MPKTTTEPQAYSEEDYEHIPLVPVKSSQLAAVGYDAGRKTLAITFAHGKGAIYHYPNVIAKTHADMVAAESVGTFFGKHIKHLPFHKFKAPEPAKA